MFLDILHQEIQFCDIPIDNLIIVHKFDVMQGLGGQVVQMDVILGDMGVKLRFWGGVR